MNSQLRGCATRLRLAFKLRVLLRGELVKSFRLWLVRVVVNADEACKGFRGGRPAGLRAG